MNSYTIEIVEGIVGQSCQIHVTAG